MRTKFNIGEEVFFMKFGSEASKNTVNEDKVFRTKEELIEDVFKNL